MDNVIKTIKLNQYKKTNFTLENLTDIEIDYYNLHNKDQVKFYTRELQNLLSLLLLRNSNNNSLA